MPHAVETARQLAELRRLEARRIKVESVQKQVGAFCVALVLFAMAFSQTHTATEEHYVFIAFYLATGVFALYNRLPYAVAAMASVALVRYAVADHWTGVQFQVVSAIFAGLQLVLVLRLLYFRNTLRDTRARVEALEMENGR